MTDKSYKPVRRNIQEEDLQANPMAGVNQVQAAIQQTLQQDTAPNASGMEIKGLENAPPQFREALARGKGVQPTKFGKREDQLTDRPSGMLQTSNHLQELISHARNIGGTYESIELPSRGIFYDGTDGPQDGILRVRPMTGEEEEVLATQRFIQKGQAIGILLGNCIDGVYNTDKFLNKDREYLMIYLRGISYSPEYDVEVRCPECNKRFNTTVDLNELYVESCPDTFNISSLKGVLPTTNYKFSYRLPTGKDENELKVHRDRRSKEFDTSSSTDDTLLFWLVLLINEIEGLTNKQELRVLLKALPISDINHLRDTINDIPFGVDTEIDMVCPSCMMDFNVALPFETSFFFPKRKKVKTPA